MSSYPKQCLIVAPNWVGDLVMAQAAFKWLKKKSPETELHVLANAWVKDVLSRMPEVDHVIESPFQHGELAVKKRFQFAKNLRSHHFDQAIVFTNSFKSALIPFFANIPKRTGFLGECRYGVINDVRILRPKKMPRMVDRFMQLVVEKNEPVPVDFDFPKLRSNETSSALILKKYNVPAGKNGIIAISAGAAFGSAKRWPISRFAELTRSLLQKEFSVCLLGSKDDRFVTDAILELASNHTSLINLAGLLKLDETIDLLASSEALIGNDSGLLHIASSLGIPVVGIYGSTSPDFAPPLTEKSVIVTAAPKLPCQPCKQRDCPLHHHACMHNINMKHVLDACLTLVETAP